MRSAMALCLAGCFQKRSAEALGILARDFESTRQSMPLLRAIRTIKTPLLTSSFFPLRFRSNQTPMGPPRQSRKQKRRPGIGTPKLPIHVNSLYGFVHCIMLCTGTHLKKEDDTGRSINSKTQRERATTTSQPERTTAKLAFQTQLILSPKR